MSRSRIPVEKAQVSGAAIINAGRFADRTAPKRSRPIGEPYARMTEAECAAWYEFKQDLPWLTASDRVSLEATCKLTARMRERPDFGIQGFQALSAMLSKLGATPADRSKVNHAPEEPEDDLDRLLDRPN